MAKDSSEPKVIKRTLCGLIFYPKKLTDQTYISVNAWLAAGKPDNATIFDNVDTLLVSGIPICDGIPVKGMYRRVPTRKARPAEVKIIPYIMKDLKPAEVKTKVKGIQVAETKVHNRMIY
jgi:hypothetical protein